MHTKLNVLINENKCEKGDVKNGNNYTERADNRINK